MYVGYRDELPVALDSLRHPRFAAWLILSHCVIRSFAAAGLLTILSLPACGGTCALNLVTGIWLSWPGNLASASPRARFYDGSYVLYRSSRNVGKPMRGRSAIPGG